MFDESTGGGQGVYAAELDCGERRTRDGSRESVVARVGESEGEWSEGRRAHRKGSKVRV